MPAIPTKSIQVTDDAPVQLDFYGSGLRAADLPAQSLAVRWKGALLPATVHTGSIEFSVPRGLRGPGLVEYGLWDTANQTALPYRGFFQVLLPPADAAEADMARDLLAAFAYLDYDKTSAEIRVYTLST